MKAEQDVLRSQVRVLERRVALLTGLIALSFSIVLVAWIRPAPVVQQVIKANEFQLIAPDGETILGSLTAADGSPALILQNSEQSEFVWIHPGTFRVQSSAGELEIGETEQGFQIALTDTSGVSLVRLLVAPLGGGFAAAGSGGGQITMGAFGESAGMGLSSPEGVARVSLVMAGEGQKLTLTDKQGNATAVLGFGSHPDGEETPLFFFTDDQQDLWFDALGTVSVESESEGAESPDSWDSSFDVYDAETKDQLRSAASAYEAYFAENGTYAGHDLDNSEWFEPRECVTLEAEGNEDFYVIRATHCQSPHVFEFSTDFRSPDSGKARRVE